MRRGSGQARPGAHRFRGTATRGDGAHVPGLLPGAPLQSAGRRRPQGAAQPAPTRSPVPGRASRHASRVIAAGTARWSHPYRPCPRRALANGYEQSPAVNSLRSVLTWPFSVGARAALPRAVPSKLVARSSYKVAVGGGTEDGQRRSHRGCPGAGQIRRTGPTAAEDRPGPVARPADGRAVGTRRPHPSRHHRPLRGRVADAARRPRAIRRMGALASRRTSGVGWFLCACRATSMGRLAHVAAGYSTPVSPISQGGAGGLSCDGLGPR
jgi:hypothetical protein